MTAPIAGHPHAGSPQAILPGVARFARDTLLPLVMACAVRMIAATWRVRRTGGRLLEDSLARGPVVFALFHEDLLVLGALHRGLGILPVVSLSSDGELLARVLKRIGYATVRGSSSRGAVRAARAALRALDRQEGSPAVAVDGPRGPRHRVQQGVVAMAARSGRPIVYAVARAAPRVRCTSWDRFRIPLPFARVEIRYGRVEPPSKAHATWLREAEDLGQRMRAWPDSSGGLR
ncbi:MAG: DUF374 domain-containing protein [Deltaproteobacteria bacterium]|nr:DUF374 domain-containing protein [Deltaproteobacteria bacterium]